MLPREILVINAVIGALFVIQVKKMFVRTCIYVQCMYVQCMYVQCMYVQCMYVQCSARDNGRTPDNFRSIIALGRAIVIFAGQNVRP